MASIMRGMHAQWTGRRWLARVCFSLLACWLSMSAIPSALANSASRQTETPMSTSLVQAAKAADPAALRKLLDSGANANTMSSDREPLIIVAQMAGRWDNVKLLIERGADINAFAHGNRANTVLAFYSAGQFDKALWLLEHGADPGYRIESAAAPNRIGAQPVVENIYWWPVHTGQYPALAQAQRKCQDIIAARGFKAPPEPEHLRQLRESRQRAGSTQPSSPLNEQIRATEDAVKRKLEKP
jgi:hypothetical protein